MLHVSIMPVAWSIWEWSMLVVNVGGESYTLSRPGASTWMERINAAVWCTLRGTNIAMENGPIEDVFPIKSGGFPLLC